MSASRICKALGLLPGDGGLVLSLGGLLVAASAARELVSLGARPLLLATLGSDALAWVYVGAAPVSAVLALGLARLQATENRRALLIQLGLALGLVASIVALWWAPSGRSLLVVRCTWAEVTGAMLELSSWGLILAVLDPRQGRRLFGPLLAADAIGGGVAAAVGGQLAGSGRLAWLEPAAVVALVLGAALVLRVPVEADDDDDDTHAPETGVSEGQRLEGRLAWMVAASTVSFYLLDLLYCGLVESEVSDVGALGKVLGSVSAGVQLVALVAVTLTSAPLLRWLGVRATAALPPLLLLPGAVLVGVVLVAIGGLPAVVAAAVLWGVDRVGRDAAEEPSGLILLQALPPGLRARAQARTEGVVEPLCAAAVGAVVLVLPLDALSPERLVWALGAALGAWLLLTIRVGHTYTAVLEAAIVRGWLGQGRLRLDDASTRAVLRKHLASPQPRLQVATLQLMARADGQGVLPEAVDLLASAHPTVRRAACELVRASGTARLVPQLVSMWDAALAGGHADVVLDALSAVAPEVAAGRAAEVSEHASDALRLAALRVPGPHRGPALRSLAVSTLVADRRLAARVGGFDGWSVLLADPTAEVVAAALACVAGGQPPADVPGAVAAAIGGLACPVRHGPACGALVALAPESVGGLSRALQEGGDADLLAGLVRIPGAEADALLHRWLADAPAPPAAWLLREAARRHLTLDPTRLDRWIARLVDVDRALGVWVRRTAGVEASLARRMQEARSLVRQRLATIVVLRADRPDLAVRFTLPLDRSDPGPVIELLDDQLPLGLRSGVVAVLEGPSAVLPAAMSSPVPGGWSVELGGLLDTGLDDRAVLLHLHHLASEHGWTALRDRIHHRLVPLLPPQLDLEHPPMPAPLERVLILRTAGIFDHTPDDILVDVAARCAAIDHTPGDTVLAQGDPGDSVYFIVTGTLEVLRDGRSVRMLHDGAMFGELAVLDPQPRSATVVARTHVQLLRLDRVALQQLIEVRPEVGLGIIRELCRRLRARDHDPSGTAPQLPTSQV